MLTYNSLPDFERDFFAMVTRRNQEFRGDYSIDVTLRRPMLINAKSIRQTPVRYLDAAPGTGQGVGKLPLFAATA
jgi:hypothetical protein